MDSNALRLQLIQTLCRLPADKLAIAAEALRRLEAPPASSTGPDHRRGVCLDWPHAPLHRLSEHGAYMVTTGTYQKLNIFRDAERLTILEHSLLQLASKYGWHLEAWAVFSNHYHFIGYHLSEPESLRDFLKELHANTARDVNLVDDAEGRQVWHNFWDKHLTYEKSYLARLNYVHQNPVKHGLVRVANQYRWCSAAWFERVARPAQVKTIYSFKTDRLHVADDFQPLAIV
jgi:putative transposase